jgi:hypothetical protein
VNEESLRSVLTLSHASSETAVHTVETEERRSPPPLTRPPGTPNRPLSPPSSLRRLGDRTRETLVPTSPQRVLLRPDGVDNDRDRGQLGHNAPAAAPMRSPMRSRSDSRSGIVERCRPRLKPYCRTRGATARILRRSKLCCQGRRPSGCICSSYPNQRRPSRPRDALALSRPPDYPAIRAICRCLCAPKLDRQAFPTQRRITAGVQQMPDIKVGLSNWVLLVIYWVEEHGGSYNHNPTWRGCVCTVFIV